MEGVSQTQALGSNGAIVQQFQLYLPYVLLLLFLQSEFDEDLLKLLVTIINNKLLKAVVLGERKGNTRKTVSPALPTKDTPRFTPYAMPHAPFRLDGGPTQAPTTDNVPCKCSRDGSRVSEQTKYAQMSQFLQVRILRKAPNLFKLPREVQ